MYPANRESVARTVLSGGARPLPGPDLLRAAGGGVGSESALSPGFATNSQTPAWVYSTPVPLYPTSTLQIFPSQQRHLLSHCPWSLFANVRPQPRVGAPAGHTVPAGLSELRDQKREHLPLSAPQGASRRAPLVPTCLQQKRYRLWLEPWPAAQTHPFAEQTLTAPLGPGKVRGPEDP